MTLNPHTIDLLKRRTICGARTKRGAVCERLSTPGNKRCYYHGGASTGCRTAEGKAAAVTAMVDGRKRWIARMHEEVKAGLRDKVPGGRKPGETNTQRAQASQIKQDVKAAKPISPHMKRARIMRDEPDNPYAQDLTRTLERAKREHSDKHDAKFSELVYRAACEGVAGDLIAHVRNTQRAKHAPPAKPDSERPSTVTPQHAEGFNGSPAPVTVAKQSHAALQSPERSYGPYSRYPGRDAPEEPRPYRSAHPAHPHPGNLRDGRERDRWMPHMRTKR